MEMIHCFAPSCRHWRRSKCSALFCRVVSCKLILYRYFPFTPDFLNVQQIKERLRHRSLWHFHYNWFLARFLHLWHYHGFVWFDLKGSFLLGCLQFHEVQVLLMSLISFLYYTIECFLTVQLKYSYGILFFIE